MARTAADFMAETLAEAGVKRVYGVVGDSLNGFTDALGRHDEIAWLHVRHEEGARLRRRGRGASDRLARRLRRQQSAPHQGPV